MGTFAVIRKRCLDFSHLCWVALALCWLDLFRSLEVTWRFDPQYFYGYLIPVAGAVLFWKAWNRMPLRQEPPPSVRAEWLFWVVAGFCWLTLTAVLEVNAYGRLFLWGKALLVCGVTAGFIWRQGGMPALRYMGMLLVFLLLSVPWPTRLEEVVVGGLAFLVTTVTVDVLNVVGYTVLQQGRLIDFGGAAPLGVEEACSGIRSLQLSLAFSLYYGELQRLGMIRRLGLVAGGVVLAFIGNLVRTFGLSYVAIEHEMENFKFWHDTFGIVVFIIVLGGLWAAGSWMGRGSSAARQEMQPSKANSWLRADRYRFAGVAVFVVAGFLMVQAWFLINELGEDDIVLVEFDWRQVAPDVELSDLPEAAAETLAFEYGVQAVWTEAGDRRWIGAYVDWDDHVAVMASELHRPDVCLRASGNDLLEYHQPVRYQLGQRTVDIRCYSFLSYSGDPFYVFYVFWMDGGNDWELEMGSWQHYLQYTLRGIRFQGAKMIQIYAPHGLDETEAKTRVVEILDAGLQVKP